MSNVSQGAAGKPIALSEADLWNILEGACILGCGGGGPLSLGTQLVKQIVKGGTVYLANPATDIDDVAVMAVAAGIGSPLAASHGFSFDILTTAFKKLDELQSKTSGKRFSYVLPGEVGACNTILPMTVAMSLELPIIDAAGARRALPQMQMASFASKQVEISPVVLARGSQTITFDAPNATVAQSTVEGILSVGGKQDAGIAMWSMSGKTMKASAVHNTTTFARDLGRTLSQARSSGDPVEAVRAYLGGVILFRGRIESSNQQTLQGADLGVINLKDASGSEFLRIYNQNENLIAWSSKSAQPLAMAPDLICYLTADGQPFTNADLKLAQDREVAVIAAACTRELRDPGIVAYFLKILQAIGYGGPYVPLDKGKDRAIPATASGI